MDNVFCFFVHSQIKVENTSKQVIFKGLAPRVVLTNHLLPKGTKTKVNLEEQGRQKVSFSFTQTKKPRQKVFLVPPTPEKAASEIPPAVQSTNLPSADLTGQSAESKNEQIDPSVVAESQATQSSVPLASKLKHDKVHFKKQILSVSVVEERPTVSAILNDTTSDTEVLLRSTAGIKGEPSVVTFQHNSVTDCSEKVNREESAQEILDIHLKGPTDSSHIGKECKDSISEPEHSRNVHHSDNTLPGSDTDGESVRTSSSQKCSDSKNVAKCDSQSAVKKFSSSKSEVSDRSRSDKREEKDEKGSSRCKSERDTRHLSSRSSHSDRRRTKSRSRSRSRSSRTSSSYSRSERSRNERPARSDRSHYHDSERRSHRSSREQRRSRSRGDGRSRDSSDSEDDLRKPRTRGSDSSRSSTYSSSQRDSKTSSHSKSYRDSKSDSKSSPHSSESDKRTQYSRPERSGKTSGSELSKRISPETEASHKKSSSHSKSEVHGKTSNLNNISKSEKKVPKTSGSSDSDDEHKMKTRFQSSDRSPRSSVKKTNNSESKSSSIGTDGQLVAKLNVNAKLPHLDSDKIKSQGEFKVDVCSQHEESRQSKLTDNSSQQKQQVILKDSLKSHVEIQGENKDSYVAEKWLAVSEVNISKCHVTLKDISLEDDQLRKQTDILIQNKVQILKDAQTNVANVGTFFKTDSSSLNEPPCPGYTPSQDSLGSLADTLSVKELSPGECLKPNTKFVSQLFLSNEVSGLPRNVETSQKVTEQSDIKPEQVNAATIKHKGAHVKKSRWDIVGQDTLENQTPQKMLNNETSSVKRVISVKKIEFNSDASHEEKCSKKEGPMMDSLKSELEEQTDKATPDSEKEIKQDHDQPFAIDAQQTNKEGSAHVSDKSLANQVLLKPNCSPDVIHIDQTYASSDKLNSDNSYKPLTQESVPFNCDGKSHSEDSETDDSDSDSDDDGHVSLKRLHSVVVVPKNSTIILETSDQPTPPASPSALSGQHQLTYQTDELSISINSEIPNSLNTPIKPVESSAEGNKHDILSVAENKCIPSVQMPYQSQSNMVDSTSQSEATTTVAHTDRNCTVKERPKTCVPTDQVPTYTQREVESGCQQYHDNPDSWHGRKGGREQFEDFSCIDNLRPQNGLNMACDFTQTEQPSSTFQQPDSSHSTQRPSQIGSAFTRQDNGYWIQAKVSDKSIPANTLVPSPFHESMYQVHPDSLTNDHEEDYEGKAFRLSGGIIPSRKPPASSVFVQANEISSNCSFVTATAESQIIAEPPRECSQKPHRGRGPPKKRRPELESESDNEAEAGLAYKRECLEERESCKGMKETKVSSQQEEKQWPLLSLKEFLDPAVWKEKAKHKKMPPYFDLIEENVYLTERSVSLLD